MSEHRWLYAWGMGSVAIGAASLLVPLYVVALGGDPFELGLLGAVAAFIGAPGSIVWGRLADRTSNPRGILLASLIGVGILLIVLPLTGSIPVVILGNALLWLVFAAAAPVLTLVVVADVPEAEWSSEIALFNTYQGYGWAGGLLLGILWSATAGRLFSAAFTQRSLFVLCGVTAVLSALLLAHWMPAPTDRQLDRVDPARVARILSVGRRGVRGATFAFTPNRLYWSTVNLHPRRIVDRFTPTLARYFLGVVLFFTGFAVFFAPLPLYLTGVGFTSDHVFGLYLIAGLGSAVFYSGAGKLSSSYDLRLLQTAALGVRAVAMPLVAIVGSVFAASLLGATISGILFFLIGMTWAVIAVTAGTIVTRTAPSGVRGEALGVYAALSVLAGGFGSIGGGILANRAGFTVAFGAAGFVILLGAGIVISLREITRRTKTHDRNPASEPLPDPRED